LILKARDEGPNGDKRSVSTVIWLVSGYLAIQMVSDVTAVKIVRVFGIFVPAAVFLYSLAFTWIDLVNDHLGRENARLLVIAAATVNLFMSIYFQFSIALPVAPFWKGQEAFAAILGGVWRIVIASIIAEVVNTLLDVEIFHQWKVRIAHLHTVTGWRWVRVIVSNAISLTADSVVFVTLAFYGTMPILSMIAVIWGQLLVKGIMTLFSIPLIYMVSSRPVKISD